MPNPKVSVLITAYNYGHYIGDAIQSVLDQTFDDFELIILDNQSTDDTIDVVNTFIEKDTRIKFIVNKTNIGMFRNYNEGLLHARGEYIKFLNADDKFHPQILEKFVKILDKYHDVSLVTSHRQYFHSSAEIQKTNFSGLQDAKEMILLALSKINFIGEPTTVMFRRENLNVGLFDTSLIFFADLDMWLRQLSVGNLYIVNEVLSYVRKHEAQGTQELRGNTDKAVFIALQWPEYVRNSILMNRFGYNLYEENKITRNKILKKATKVAHRLLFSNSNNNARIRDYFSPINPTLYFRYFIKNIFNRN
ncbi:MAG TPA: hypothetical protein CFH84_07495 [Sulfurimonas sp. UBA12504]|nr:MAG: hypothetical protein A2019_04995 [Sulfurimonas sp. GWF2_37_8]DAB29786.1 MAG TPA: hypothetical protein CFH84_07495 [Sulfurimonas sp. UBA12504]